MITPSWDLGGTWGSLGRAAPALEWAEANTEASLDCSRCLQLCDAFARKSSFSLSPVFLCSLTRVSAHPSASPPHTPPTHSPPAPPPLPLPSRQAPSAPPSPLSSPLSMKRSWYLLGVPLLALERAADRGVRKARRKRLLEAEAEGGSGGRGRGGEDDTVAAARRRADEVRRHD